MRKSILALCIIVLAVFCITACEQQKEEEKGEFVEELQSLNSVMGGEDPALKKGYDAKDIPQTTLDQKYLNEVSEIMEGKTAFGKKYKSLILDELKTWIEDDRDRGINNEWQKAKTFYVSKKAVYSWRVDDNEIAYACPEIYVFSKDLKKYIGVFELWADMEEEDYSLSDAWENINTKMEDLFKNSKEKKFFSMYVGQTKVIMDENNKIILGDEAEENIKGDYASALDEMGLAVTMEQLMDPDNLVEITFP